MTEELTCSCFRIVENCHFRGRTALRAAIDLLREEHTSISSFPPTDAKLKDESRRISPTAGAIQRSAADSADA